jgi:hypothetical protein
MKPHWTRIAGALAAALLLLAGCIPSLQPPYLEKDLVRDERLPGVFEGDDGNPRWTFSEAGEKEYKLTIADKESTSLMQARLFKIENQLFLDLAPGDGSLDDCKRDDFFKAALVPAHIFFKVSRLDRERFEFQSLEEEWLKKLLRADPRAVAHTVIANERIVFTASSAEMRKFLASHLETPGAWSDPAKLVRRKTP